MPADQFAPPPKAPLSEFSDKTRTLLNALLDAWLEKDFVGRQVLAVLGNQERARDALIELRMCNAIVFVTGSPPVNSDGSISFAIRVNDTERLAHVLAGGSLS